MENTTNNFTNSHPRSNDSLKNMTFTAMFMALTIVLSSFGIPVPGGHLYLCDIVICTAAILLSPGYAFVAAGVGSFLGDMLFYPAPMFVSLVTHGIQAIVISLFVHHIFKHKQKLGAVIGVSIGAVIMVVGYTLGKIYVYSTFEYAMLKLPFEIAQAVLGAVGGIIIVYGLGLKSIYTRWINK